MDRIRSPQPDPERLEVGDAVRLTIANETYKVRREQDGYCTCVPATCSFLWFNETGFLILVGLARQLSVSALVEEMNRRFPLSRSYWEEAVNDFFDYLMNNDMLPDDFK